MYVLLRDITQNPCMTLDNILNSLVELQPALTASIEATMLRPTILGKPSVERWFSAMEKTSPGLVLPMTMQMPTA